MKALKLREETLDLRKAKLGPDHVDTIASRGNLALSYMAIGRNAEAVKIGEETLALEKAKRGLDHPETITSMQVLALGYSSLGRQSEAIRVYEEALPRAKSRLGPDHPETIRIMHNLSAAYAAVSRNVEALKLGEEELALRRTKLGFDHPQTLNSMRNVAAFLAALGRHADALKLREEVLALKKTKLGLAHPDTLRSMSNLALSYLAAGRLPEASAILEQAVDRNDPESSLGARRGSSLVRPGPEIRRDAASLPRVRQGDRKRSHGEPSRPAGALRPSIDPAELEAVLALGRSAVDLNKGEWELLALGMAEYRSGHFVAAAEALRATEKAGKEPIVAEIAAFYGAEPVPARQERRGPHAGDRRRRQDEAAPQG